MSSVITRRVDCRFCGSCDLKLVFQLAPTPLGSDYIPAGELGENQECYPMDLFSCGECGYVGLTEVTVEDGQVTICLEPQGNAEFYRVEFDRR